MDISSSIRWFIVSEEMPLIHGLKGFPSSCIDLISRPSIIPQWIDSDNISLAHPLSNSSFYRRHDPAVLIFLYALCIAVEILDDQYSKMKLERRAENIMAIKARNILVLMINPAFL